MTEEELKKILEREGIADFETGDNNGLDGVVDIPSLEEVKYWGLTIDPALTLQENLVAHIKAAIITTLTDLDLSVGKDGVSIFCFDEVVFHLPWKNLLGWHGSFMEDQDEYDEEFAELIDAMNKAKRNFKEEE